MVEAGWLRALGVTNAAGEARPGMASKLRQIQRFVELLGHLVDDSPLGALGAASLPRQLLRVVDMGAGKGYLTFATAEFFRARGVEAEITGVEARGELVELTNRVAREHGFARLNFVQGTIADFTPPQPLDILLALHACDTATDDALAKAVQAGATLILAAPCCHKEVRAQLQPPAVLREVLRHGILAEREAEIVTDGLRALLLEMHGYRANVFEFISPEDTSKNLMLSAQRRTQPVDAAPLRAQFRGADGFPWPCGSSAWPLCWANERFSPGPIFAGGVAHPPRIAGAFPGRHGGARRTTGNRPSISNCTTRLTPSGSVGNGTQCSTNWTGAAGVRAARGCSTGVVARASRTGARWPDGRN